jgi:hypothetical protein
MLWVWIMPSIWILPFVEDYPDGLQKVVILFGGIFVPERMHSQAQTTKDNHLITFKLSPKQTKVTVI